ncbi:MAG: acyl-CoA dehydratase activase-related protein, partial [Oscillospiraceae bacterium]|jgi:predicted CoA-substrate-specific enzyme activase|nr:acyl-CoA dehydratase activase-related protein [Oscillospiraceae bacterium]
VSVTELKTKITDISDSYAHEVKRLPSLFENENKLAEFRTRHAAHKIPTSEIADTKGEVFLGIDIGSTTTKAALIDSDARIIYSYYGGNKGDPLMAVINILKDIYANLPKGAFIGKVCTTGYGEHLIKAALRCDKGEVETVAHCTAAQKILPGVNFILDIGGQDMKCITLKYPEGNTGAEIDNLLLNEACSSGCGSFIENFANALGMTAAEFSQIGLLAKNPVDLGSRSTVFMNSRVKQAQKEGAEVADISAGLSLSVVKNALYKVIRLRDNSQMGERVIVQGGTFLNESVLRAFEAETGREVVRPDKAGLMGAYGAALIAAKLSDGEQSTILSLDELDKFTVDKRSARCGKCPNNCLLTISKFPDGEIYVTNNRCEKGDISGKKKLSDKEKMPDIYDWKYKRIFNYKSTVGAKRGKVGIPRVLGMYENYPFWFTFFDKLGYEVIVSPESSRGIFDLGMETMPSESVCYPAKLMHGAVQSLINDGIKFIFYPSLTFETDERANTGGDNHYNCPIVATYGEVIKNCVPEIHSGEVSFLDPFLPIYEPNRMSERLVEEFCGKDYFDKTANITGAEIGFALAKAYEEQEKYRAELRAKGEETLRIIAEKHGEGIVLAGRPYHIDPEINHGIPQMLSGYGYAVLSEDSIAHLGQHEGKLRITDQWTYHSRLFTAAEVVCENDNLELIQLNSFGCGLDAVTIEQCAEILHNSGKTHTVLKIDEVNNLGAARIRVRSLISVIEDKKRRGTKRPRTVRYTPYTPPYFAKEFKKRHTILAPQMSPSHFDILEAAFNYSGYNFEILKEFNGDTVETGLKYVNNDACYPAIMVVGQLMHALDSGKYDLDNTSVMIVQTGGTCRATNYYGLLKKALSDGGYRNTPLISLNFQGMERQKGFHKSVAMLMRAFMSLIYGDALMKCLYRTRPYEVVAGSAQELRDKLAEEAKLSLKTVNFGAVRRTLEKIFAEFDKLPITDVKKPRVGVVGEVLVKYHPGANNDIVGVLEKEGAEAVVPDLMGFMLFLADHANVRHQYLTCSTKRHLLSNLAIKAFLKLQKPYRDALSRHPKFGENTDFDHIRKLAENVVSTGNIAGEGWFLTAEMLELIETGVNNIVCIQPFACLPNHVTGKGVIGELRRRHPESNIVAVDYDPGASEVNQLNRIKLMLAGAK